MKKKTINIIIAFLSFFAFSFSSKAVNENAQPNPVILQFVTINGFGNNLYLDNISFGNKPDNDIAMISINNINKDTTFLPGVNSFTINPVVSIANIGLYTPIDTLNVVFSVGRYNYSDTVFIVSPFSPGQAANLTFPALTIYPNRPLDIAVYLDYSRHPQDTSNQYRLNDTLRQISVFLNGTTRNVLFEEFTSTTSPSCASNNPTLDNFINLNFNTVCAIKYHVGFPFPGNDSMYLPDTVQLIQRSNYYFVTAVPDLLADGVYRMPLPYSFQPNIDTTYSKRILIGTPVSLSVTDSRPGGDTIQSVVNVNNLYNLPPGDYRLRVITVERNKNYTNAPGSNGEKQFYDIFRQAYPDSAGIIINPLAGNYTYTIKYLKQTYWVDSMIYTVAFIQNDNTKEVLNCAKGRQYPHATKLHLLNSRLPVIYRPDINRNSRFVPFGYYIKQKSDSGITNTNFEFFEGPFPPSGWIINNPDKGLSFEQAIGVNGNSFGGSACTRMPFYNYSNVGQRDTLTSISFYNVTSSDSLRFDYAYAQFLSEYADTLTVKISTNGGADFITIFQKGGTLLATSPATTLPFTPIAASDWKTYSYPMSLILPSNINQTDVTDYHLFPNYPNPFNPKTNIKFQVPHSSQVLLKIYDITGREIKTLVNQRMNKGIYTVEFDGGIYASGIYFCQMISDNFIKVLKLALVK